MNGASAGNTANEVKVKREKARRAIAIASLIGCLGGCGGRSELLDEEFGGLGAIDASLLDAPAVDANDAAPPPPACSIRRARVFVSSAMYDGNLGGVGGADADCTASAKAQKLGGRWRAWLSDTKSSAPSRIYAAPDGFVLLDGTLVAKDLSALVSGSLAHAIDLTESKTTVSDGNTEVWTGIDVRNGTGSPGYCSDGAGHDWSSNRANAPTPLVGHEDATDDTWTAAYLQFCNRTNVRLYCFEACN
jgi:hypothetical protein